VNAVTAQLPTRFGALDSFHCLKQLSPCFALTQRNRNHTLMDSAMRFAIWTASRAREIWPWLPPQFRARNYIYWVRISPERCTLWTRTFPVQSG